MKKPAKWWLRLKEKGQRAYLSRHPGSRYWYLYGGMNKETIESAKPIALDKAPPAVTEILEKVDAEPERKEAIAARYEKSLTEGVAKLPEFDDPKEAEKAIEDDLAAMASESSAPESKDEGDKPTPKQVEKQVDDDGRPVSDDGDDFGVAEKLKRASEPKPEPIDPKSTEPVNTPDKKGSPPAKRVKPEKLNGPDEDEPKGKKEDDPDGETPRERLKRRMTQAMLIAGMGGLAIALSATSIYMLANEKLVDAYLDTIQQNFQSVAKPEKASAKAKGGLNFATFAKNWRKHIRNLNVTELARKPGVLAVSPRKMK